jgi:flagellar protein FliS
MYSPSGAIAQYQKVNNVGQVEDASPHRLILMLMAGALDRLAQARSAIEHKDISLKGRMISKATNIIEGLQGSLDRQQAPEYADNLDRLYDYMQRRLLEANLNNDIRLLDEVSELMRTIKSGWEEIAPGATANAQ